MYSLLRQKGLDPDQPLDEQVREDEPDIPYPVLQLYVALPPLKYELTDTRPLLGLFSVGQLIPKFRIIHKSLIIIIAYFGRKD